MTQEDIKQIAAAEREAHEDFERLLDGLTALEERTRRNGDMADQAVNAEVRRLLRMPIVQ